MQVSCFKLDGSRWILLGLLRKRCLKITAPQRKRLSREKVVGNCSGLLQLNCLFQWNNYVLTLIGIWCVSSGERNVYFVATTVCMWVPLWPFFYAVDTFLSLVGPCRSLFCICDCVLLILVHSVSIPNICMAPNQHSKTTRFSIRLETAGPIDPLPKIV